METVARRILARAVLGWRNFTRNCASPPRSWTFIALWLVTSVAGGALGSHLVWNATPSLPLGLYWRSAEEHVHRGDLVALRIPADVRVLVHERAYLPDGSFLIKPVVGIAADVVCAQDGVLLVNTVPFGEILSADSEGRALPQYDECLTLDEGQVFLASPHPRSFDSRTFGPVDVRALKGTVIPLWTY